MSKITVKNSVTTIGSRTGSLCKVDSLWGLLLVLVAASIRTRPETMCGGCGMFVMDFTCNSTAGFLCPLQWVAAWKAVKSLLLRYFCPRGFPEVHTTGKIHVCYCGVASLTRQGKVMLSHVKSQLRVISELDKGKSKALLNFVRSAMCAELLYV